MAADANNIVPQAVDIAIGEPGGIGLTQSAGQGRPRTL